MWNLQPCGGFAGEVAGREGHLKVVAAGVAVHIQHFAGEVEAGLLLGLEGLGGNFVGGDAACGNYAALEAHKTSDVQLPVLHGLGDGEVDEVIEDVELLDADDDIESEENVNLNETED